MPRPVVAFAYAVMVHFGASQTHAQVRDAIGWRVRVTIPDQSASGRALNRTQSLRGTVAALRGDTVILNLSSRKALAQIAVVDILRIERSAGLPSRWRNALLYGLVSGLGGAAVAGFNYRRPSCYGFRSRSVAATAVGATGFVLGALYGAVNIDERWRRFAVRP